MKKLLAGILLLFAAGAADAITYQSVRASTTTALTPAIQNGTMNLSSGTITNLNSTNLGAKYLTVSSTASFVGVTGSTISYSSATFTGVNASTITVSSLTATSANILGGTAALSTLSATSLSASTATITSSMTVQGNAVIQGTATFTGRISTSAVSGSGYGSAGMALMSAGPSAPPVWAKTGMISNIQKFSNTTSTTTTVATFVRSGYAVSITPSLVTSSIGVVATCDLSNAAAQTANSYATLERNATNLAGANGMVPCNFGLATTGAIYCPFTIWYIDAPNSTSSVTYEIYMRTSGGGVAAGLNGQGETCYVWAYEIGG